MEFLSSDQKSLSKDILEDILLAINTVEERVDGIQEPDDFENSSEGMILLDATCMLMIAIGESLKNLDKITDGHLLPERPEIEWRKVKGMRDIIAHHYFDIDSEQVFWIVKNEISPLKEAIKYLLNLCE